MRHSLLGQAHEPTGRALLVSSDGGPFSFPPTPRKLSLVIAQLARALCCTGVLCCNQPGQGWDLQRAKLTRNALNNLFLLILSLYPQALTYYAPSSQHRDLPFVCNHTRYYQYHLDQCAVFILRDLSDAQIAESP